MKSLKESNIYKSIRGKLFAGHNRSIALKKNIIISVVFKGLSIATSFLLVPLCINYLDELQYGIWLIVSSFLYWFALFGIGLGSGMQNKLAEALGLNKRKLAKEYISTTYISIFSIMLVCLTIFIFVHPYIAWHKVFNVSKDMESQLSLMALVAFIFFFLQFVFRLLNSVLFADQKAGISNTLGPISNILVLIVIFFVSRTFESSLLYLTLSFCGCQLLVIVVANLYFFNKDYKDIRPSIKYFKKSALYELLGLGIKFFVIQISAIFMLQATNIIIAQLFSPNEVTQFEISKKLFSITFIGFQFITTPLWPAYTQAYATKDVDWIRRTTRKLIKLWLLIFGGTTVLFLISPFLYELWVGDKVQIPLVLSLVVAVHFLLFIFGNIFNVFINGVGKLRVQLISLLIGSILYLPLAYLFKTKFGLGVEGVVIAMIISNFYSYIIAPIQYRKIINGTATGIWDK